MLKHETNKILSIFIKYKFEHVQDITHEKYCLTTESLSLNTFYFILINQFLKIVWHI